MEQAALPTTPEQTPAAPPTSSGRPARGLRSALSGLLVPFLAVFTAVLIGSVLILFAGLDPVKAFQGLVQGAFGTDGALVRSLLKMTPLILAGLAVAFAFKGGLFNIGAQGQLAVGSIMAAWVGFLPSTGVRLVAIVLTCALLYLGLQMIGKRLKGSYSAAPAALLAGISVGLIGFYIGLNPGLFSSILSGLTGKTITFPSGPVPGLIFGCVVGALTGALSLGFIVRRSTEIILLLGVIFIGGLIGIFVGDIIPTENIDPLFHIILALIAGVLGGMAMAFLPGFLKAHTGAHEVITTIMLNYIGALGLEWAVQPAAADTPAGPLAACKVFGQCSGNPNRSPDILQSAFLPSVYVPAPPAADPLHIGVFIALAAAILVWILLYKTTFGFELRMVGQNPTAARYSGIKVARMTVLTLVIAGALAGLGGAIQLTGVGVGNVRNFQTNQNLAVGFDSIAVALLAANNPLAIIPSAFLFGALDAGSTSMQFLSGVPGELIQVIQALILMFVAADQIIKGLYRFRASGGGDKFKLSSNWGQR